MANWNEEAKRLLPCDPDCGTTHRVECPVSFRPAVAKALAEEANRWYSIGRADEILQPEANKLRAEIDQLKADAQEHTDLETEWTRLKIELEAERDAAVVQGLEAAEKIIRNIDYDVNWESLALLINTITNAIQAEIDKRKGK